MLQASRSELTSQLWMRASKDAAFKQELLSNPTAVIQREFGAVVSSGTHIEVLEERADKLFLVLPQAFPGLPVAPIADTVKETVREPLVGTQSCNCTNAQTC